MDRYPVVYGNGDKTFFAEAVPQNVKTSLEKIEFDFSVGIVESCSVDYLSIERSGRIHFMQLYYPASVSNGDTLTFHVTFNLE